VTAQAVMTSTHGHPRLIWPVAAKVNTIMELQNFVLGLPHFFNTMFNDTVRNLLGKKIKII